MKNIVKTIVICTLGFSALAHESHPERSEWEVISKIKDSTLANNRSRITFLISGVDFTAGQQRLVWSANNYIDTIYITKESKIIEEFNTGNYNFKLYVNSKYREIIIPKLLLDSAYSLTVQLFFRSTEGQNMMVKKPVIYLYPEVSTLLNIEVKPKGKMSFTYPEYKNGWKVQAAPSGDLTLNDQHYNYLFWESEQTFEPADFDLKKGFIVTKDQTTTFLEEKLSAFGLNSKEQADFITFWGPQLMTNELNFIHFIFNEKCDQFAEISCEPKPDNTYRIYLIFSDASDLKIDKIVPQEIPKIDRNGFIIIEWGGSEVKLNSEQFN